jgi:hypothetical protein
MNLNDIMVSWLRLQDASDCITHPYWICYVFELIHMLWMGVWMQPLQCNTGAGTSIQIWKIGV